jgi:hypothetical protein
MLQKRVYKSVNDVVLMPQELNAIADEMISQGYEVNRGPAGTVILKLDDGQVYFVPAGNSIKQILFQN